MTEAREKEVLNATRAVRDGERYSDMSKEMNLTYKNAEKFKSGWIITRWISTNEVEIDMLAYFIKTDSAESDRMDI